MEKPTLLVEAVSTPDFWLFTSFFIAGTVTLAIRKRKEPVNVYVFIGEIILAAGVALMCWLAGLYQGLDSIQICLLALPSAYGQVSLVTKIIRVKTNGTDTHKP